MNKPPTRHELHKDLWNWLAENPSKQKYDWPKWPIYTNQARSNCFACREAQIRHDEISLTEAYCLSCPITWGNSMNSCTDPGSPYSAWCDEDADNGDLTSRAEYAKQVANLPWKEE